MESKELETHWLSSGPRYAYLKGSFMNVVLESNVSCVATLRVELPADRVSTEIQSLSAEFQKQVRIPGYRPGKAPRALVESRFAKDIREEATNRLFKESLGEAIKQKQLQVISVSQVENLEIATDNTLRYKVTVVTAPEFSLPDYSSIPSEVSRKPVEDADIEKWITDLSEPHAAYDPVEGRALGMGDFAVLTYEGKIGGVALSEVEPSTPPQLQGRRNGWVFMSEDSLAPGFCQALVGMNPGEERSFSITLPEDFQVAALAGKTIDYTSSLHSINAKTVPAFDDALADKIDPGSTAEQLREKLRTRLEQLSDNKFETDKRQAALKYMLDQVQCELPTAVVNREMENILKEIVQENQVRGVSDEEIRSHHDEIVGAAQQSAVDRVRSNFILQKVAEQEKVEVSEQDFASFVFELAHRYQIPVNKFVKDLRRRNGFGALREQIVARKALDLLATKVAVAENAAAAQPSA